MTLFNIEKPRVYDLARLNQGADIGAMEQTEDIRAKVDAVKSRENLRIAFELIQVVKRIKKRMTGNMYDDFYNFGQPISSNYIDLDDY